MAMRQKIRPAQREEAARGPGGAGRAVSGATGWSRREAGRASGSGLTPEERVEDFLDRLYAPLVPCVPYAVRRQVRWEMKEHLLAIAEAYEELGSGPAEALEEAIARFGAPEQVSAQWLRAWRAPSGVASARPAAAAALKTFGQALLAGLALLHINDRWPGPTVLGDMLPIGVLVVGLPLAAGMLVGARHRRGALGTFYALSGVTLVLSPLAYIDRGQELATQLSLILACWTPVGCASAALAGWMRRLGVRAGRRLPAS